MDEDERRVRPTLYMTRGTAHGTSPFAEKAARRDSIPVRRTRSPRTKGPLSSPTGTKSGSPAAAVSQEIVITLGPNAKPENITPFSLQVLTDILKKAGLRKATISRTSADASEQARVMFENLEKFGIAAQKKLYATAGDKVIDVYRRAKAEGKTTAAIRELMTQKILRLGLTRVTKHGADPKVLNVFDVAPSSIADRPAFEKAVRSETRVKKFLVPPNDPGYHLEIPQPDSSKSSTAKP
jgi:hypothetical protein